MNVKYSALFDEFVLALADTLNPTKSFSVLTPSNEGQKSTSTQFSSNHFLTVPNSTRKDFHNLEFNEGEFDLITGALPLGLKGKHLGSTTFETSDLSKELILKLSENLTDTGYGVFLMGPLGFSGKAGEKFRTRMENAGVFIHAYVNLPPDLLTDTLVRPILIITNKKTSPLRLCSIDLGVNIEALTKDIFSENRDSKYIQEIKQNEFNGFEAFEAKKQVQRLETGYKAFKAFKFVELVESFTLGSKNKPFEDFPNSVYFKVHGGNKDLVISASDTLGRIENFIQIRLNGSVSNQYLKVFFRSTLGKLILRSTASNNITKRLNRELLFDTEIPIPDISVQNQLIEVVDRVDRLEEQLGKFKNQISLYPTNPDILSKVDAMLNISDELTEADKIKTLVVTGETEFIEFKQTFQHCLRTNKKEKYVETSALKTIVAFLNSNGGTLLIGVEDSGLIPGTNAEMLKYHRGSSDRFQLHLKDLIKTRIGVSVLSSYVNYSLVNVDGQHVLSIQCSASDREVYLDDKDFYVRTSPATEKLEGRSFSNYVRDRFYP